MILMLATTYGESVSSIPILDKGDPTGPMLKGMTYIVRPGKQGVARCGKEQSKEFWKLFLLMWRLFLTPLKAVCLVGVSGDV